MKRPIVHHQVANNSPPAG